MNHRNLISSALLLAVVAVTGCSRVVSSLPTMTTVNGDAWYTTEKLFKSRIYYCPPPTSGPAICTEARYVVSQ
ncbi:MAG: hypothetical protein H0T76_15840 [Nannocystis sp.]|nr:hypothetical protein [Nannocystis sp.]MBA3547955.1 hypothetical protein [Nannocystis sp.]